MLGNLATIPRINAFLPTDLFSRQFNPGENLPGTITLNEVTNRIDLAMRNQDIRRIFQEFR